DLSRAGAASRTLGELARRLAVSARLSRGRGLDRRARARHGVAVVALERVASAGASKRVARRAQRQIRRARSGRAPTVGGVARLICAARRAEAGVRAARLVAPADEPMVARDVRARRALRGDLAAGAAAVAADPARAPGALAGQAACRAVGQRPRLDAR